MEPPMHMLLAPVNIALFCTPATAAALVSARLARTSREEWALLAWVPPLPLLAFGLSVGVLTARDPTAANLWPFVMTFLVVLTAALFGLLLIARRVCQLLRRMGSGGGSATGCGMRAQGGRRSTLDRVVPSPSAGEHEMIDIRTAEDPASLAAARMLVRAHIVAHSTIHDAEAAEHVVATLPAPYVAPRGALWVAWENDEALGCLALHELAPDTAELKRMYVRPEARGRGVARRLTEHAIAVATARGYARLRLGTLPSMQAAQQLYASLGFERIPPYRAVEFGETWFYERALGGAVES